MASTVVGIDFGHGVIRAAEVSDANKSRPTLLRYHHIQVPTAAIDRGEVVEKATVSSAIRQLWAQAGFKSKKVVLGVGNQRVLVRDLSVPKVPLDRIKEALPFQVQEVLPVPVAEALLDFYPLGERREDGRDMINGLLVAAVKEAVLANVDAVRAAGLEPVEVDLIPFAVTRVLLAGAASRGTVAIAHIGANMTSVVVAVDGIPQFVRVAQNGGDDITNALVSRLGMDVNQAEQVKRGFGLAGDNVGPEWRPAIEVIYQVTGDLISSIRNSLSFYVTNRPGVSIERVFISGGGAQLPGLAAALADTTRLPVFVGDPLERFTIARSVSEGSINSGAAGVTVAAGLALGSNA
jgi:type IV pilus assembly protein PilM